MGAVIVLVQSMREKSVRGTLFCKAGLAVASVMYNGDMVLALILNAAQS